MTFEHGAQRVTPQQFKQNSHAGGTLHNYQQIGLGSKLLSESKSQPWESLGYSELIRPKLLGYPCLQTCAGPVIEDLIIL